MSATPLADLPTATELALSDDDWLEFVAKCPDALPYHHPAWASLLTEAYGFRGFALALRDASGRMVAGLPIVEVKTPLRPRRWVSLPYTDYLQPLAHDDTSRASLVAELEARRRAAGIAAAEVRATLEDGPSVHALPEVLGHTLELGSDPDAVFRTFKRSQIQRRIEQGEADGTRVRWAGEPADLTEVFYELHTLTRRRLGVPVQPRRFFELMWERIIEPGLGFLLIAEGEGRAAGGACFLAWNGTVIYKYSARHPELPRTRATHLILWHAIKWGCTNGYRSFDFGRTDLEDEGLREFKLGWGTEERRLAYSALADRPPSVGARSPRVLEPVIRRSPPFVSRALGELFYRYAA